MFVEEYLLIFLKIIYFVFPLYEFFSFPSIISLTHQPISRKLYLNLCTKHFVFLLKHTAHLQKLLFEQKKIKILY